MIKNYIHAHIAPILELSLLFSKTSSINKRTKQLGYDITTKSQIIDFLISEINFTKEELLRKAPEWPLALGNAYSFDSRTFLKLLSDVEAYFFQANSCWELWKKLYTHTIKHVKNQMLDSEKCIEEIDQLHKNKNISWDSRAKEIRNIIAHNGALYLALDVKKVDSNSESWDIIFMKENLHDFEDKKQFFTFKETIQFHESYIKSNKIIRDEIQNLMNDR